MGSYLTFGQHLGTLDLTMKLIQLKIKIEHISVLVIFVGTWDGECESRTASIKSIGTHGHPIISLFSIN